MAEEDTTPSDQYLLWFFLILAILALVSKIVYDYYKKLTKNHHEIFFVMMGQPECCNLTNNFNPNNSCKKYCMGKLLMKMMNRINSAKTSIAVAMYNFTNHRLADCLLRAHRRGVNGEFHLI